jgi:hypothetical protein
MTKGITDVRLVKETRIQSLQPGKAVVEKKEGSRFKEFEGQQVRALAPH